MGRMGAQGTAEERARGSSNARQLQSRRVYDLLRRAISGRRLGPGAVLNEADLSERYETSRTPLREALFRLHQEGFLEKVGRQLRVKEFSFSEVEELYQLREALEKAAARLCCERASDAQLDEIEGQLERYRELCANSDYEELNEQANAFHRALARACGNTLICRQLEAIHDKVLVINERYWGQAHSLEEAYQEHHYILNAIRRRDVTVAEAAVRAHIQIIIVLYRQANLPPDARP